MCSVGSCTGSCWEKEEERGPETRGRRVMLVRSGETMDRTFPAVWARLVGSGGGGRLCLDDVNLPRALPRELCAGDPPVTRLGGLSGRLLGEELGRRRLARPGHTLLLASPTLRCAQTAAALAAPLGLELGLEPESIRYVSFSHGNVADSRNEPVLNFLSATGFEARVEQANFLTASLSTSEKNGSWYGSYSEERRLQDNPLNS